MHETLDELVDRVYQRTEENVALSMVGGPDPYMGHDLDEACFDHISSPADDICVNAHLPIFDDRYAVHASSFYEMSYVHRGCVRLEIAGLFHELRQGDVAFVNAHVGHAVRMTAEDTRMINVLVRKRLLNTPFFDILLRNPTLSSLVVPTFFGDTEDARPFILFRHADEKCGDMRSDLESLLRSCSSDHPMRSDELALRLSLLLMDLARVYEEEEKKETGGSAGKLDLVEVVRYIQERLATSSLKEVAEHFHYTPRHFSQLVRGRYGKTFSGLLQDLRVHEAQRLLRSTDLPIGDIAEMVGTTNRAHFYQIFRDRAGVGPKEYRDSFRAAGAGA